MRTQKPEFNGTQKFEALEVCSRDVSKSKYGGSRSKEPEGRVARRVLRVHEELGRSSSWPTFFTDWFISVCVS